MSVLFLTTLYTSGRIKKPKKSVHTNIDLEMTMVNSNDFSPVHGIIPSNFCVELLFLLLMEFVNFEKHHFDLKISNFIIL